MEVIAALIREFGGTFDHWVFETPMNRVIEMAKALHNIGPRMS